MWGLRLLGESLWERGFWFGVWGLRLLGRVYEGRGEGNIREEGFGWFGRMRESKEFFGWWWWGLMSLGRKVEVIKARGCVAHIFKGIYLEVNTPGNPLLIYLG